MADVVLPVSLLLAAAAAVVLAVRALRHWWSERAGQPYELPADHRGTMLWAAAAGIAAVLAVSLAVPLLTGGRSSGGGAKEAVAAAAPGPAQPPAPLRTPEPAPLPPEVRTLGRPGGGTLQELRDGTRVWLPPRYASAVAAGVSYPVAVAELPAGPAANPDPDLFDGFAAQAKRGLADLFVLVLPRDCGQDAGAAFAEVAARYRVLPARTARGVIGVGSAAPCAVREALAHADHYGAAAGVSGTYPPLAPSTGPHPPLLLASTTGEIAPRAAARRLRADLRRRGDRVRIIDGVSARRELFALVAGYLTEKLDSPARSAPTSLTRSVPRP